MEDSSSILFDATIPKFVLSYKENHGNPYSKHPEDQSKFEPGSSQLQLKNVTATLTYSVSINK
jgi:hypothetical protein